MECVKLKATVSQGFEERSLQQRFSVLRQMKRHNIIRLGGDFIRWNSESNLGYVTPCKIIRFYEQNRNQ